LILATVFQKYSIVKPIATFLYNTCQNNLKEFYYALILLFNRNSKSDKDMLQQILFKITEKKTERTLSLFQKVHRNI
jgi:hypothetical protein